MERDALNDERTVMNDMAFLFAGFAVVWIALGAYFLFVAGRQTRLSRDIEALRREVEERKARI